MLIRIISFSLIFSLFAIGNVNIAFAQTSKSAEKKARKTAKIKRGIKKLGTGEDAKIKVKLHDKTKIEGHVESTGDDDFVIVDNSTGNTKTIKYSDVQKVSGKNMSRGVKILIGVGIGILAAIIIFEIVFHTVIDAKGVR
jgi:hypothetical protein